MYILYTYMNMYVQMMYQNEWGKEKHTRGKTTTHKHKHTHEQRDGTLPCEGAYIEM